MIDALHQAREGIESAEAWELTDISELVADLRAELDHQLKKANVKFEVASGLPVIVAMKSRIVIMLRNLVTNAIRYVSNDGSGTIKCGVREAEVEWCVFVSDNGCGVKPEFQKIIFEMFRKAPQKQKSPGMGLGLALVGKVAEQHGGRAWSSPMAPRAQPSG